MSNDAYEKCAAEVESLGCLGATCEDFTYSKMHDDRCPIAVAAMIREMGVRATGVTSGLIIRQEIMGPHFTKCHIDGLPVPAVLHHITQAEPEADPHDHPWGFTSFVIAGGYEEEVFYSTGESYTDSHWSGQRHYVPSGRVHRIIKLLDDDCWTLILPGPSERKPGFYRWDENGQALYRPWDREDFQPLQRESERVK